MVPSDHATTQSDQPAGCAAAAAYPEQPAAGQTMFPQRDTHSDVPGSDGSGPDIAGRIVVPEMSELDAATVVGAAACGEGSPSNSDGDPFTPSACMSTEAGKIPAVGQRVGDHLLIREIARGGMGIVYLANQTKLDRLVALKMILPSQAGSDAERQRFANEAKAAGGLDHPGIVPVYEVGSYGDAPYFTMAYVDGASLASKLNAGPLPAMHAAQIARDVALAISHAHGHQIIHRDLKPANILIDRSGCPKVTDFGVCKSLAGQSELTSCGEVVGTPHYMPPEQAGSGDAQVTAASDVYSIGAVLYAMLTARPPFQASSPIDVITQVMTRDPVPPGRFTSGIATDLETITMKCLSKSPKDRYQSAELLAEDLNRFLNGEPISAKPPGWIDRLRHALRKHVFLASVSGSLAFILVVFAIALGVALLRSQAKLMQLQELLILERMAARRLVSSPTQESLSEIDYDVRRLSDAAEEFAERDPDLARRLAVYAGRLALKHDVPPPDKLCQTLATFSSNPNTMRLPETGPLEAEQFSGLVDDASGGNDRKWTEFEEAVFGLFVPSHDMKAEIPTDDTDAL